jgi:hypothetical protein
VDVVNFIESKNTQGAGVRWLTKLMEHLTRPDLIKGCHNKSFNQLGLHCLRLHDWIVAFSYDTHQVFIEAILHSASGLSSSIVLCPRWWGIFIMLRFSLP